MNCETLRHQLEAGSWPQGAEVEAHLESCETCAEELAQRSGLPSGETEGASADLGSLLREVERATASETGPASWLRSRPTPIRYAIAAAAGALVIVLWSVLRPRVDLPVYPTGRLLAELGVVFVLGVLAITVSLRPLFRPAPRRGAYLALAGLAVLSAIAVTSLPPAHLDHPASLLGVGDDLVPRAVACLVAGSASALVPLLALWSVHRNRGQGRSSTLIGALGASLMGFAAILVHCPIVHSTHQWAGHLPILALVVALGWFVYRGSGSRLAH